MANDNFSEIGSWVIVLVAFVIISILLICTVSYIIYKCFTPPGTEDYTIGANQQSLLTNHRSFVFRGTRSRAVRIMNREDSERAVSIVTL